MNLYKSLSEDFRDLQLKESEKERLAKINRLKRNKLSSLKEAVNVSVSSKDSVVDVAVSDENTDVVVSEVNNLPLADEVIDAPVEPVEDLAIEEPVEEVSEIEEPVEEACDKEIKETAEDVDTFWAKVDSGEIKAGDKLKSDGAGEVEIIDLFKDKNYALVNRGGDYQPFVAAWAPSFRDDSFSWGQGHYFDKEEDARAHINGLSEACESKESCENKEEIKESAEEVGSDIIETIVSKISVEDEELANKVREILSREESVEVEDDEEELEECEVKSFRVTRVSPARNLYMIEADLSNGERSYIVGKNFNKESNVLDEAEMFTDRSKANTQFKNMLLNSKKGE
jgi:hypothetical protein